MYKENNLLQCLLDLLLALHGVVELEDANVLLSGSLLRLSKASSAVDANDEASRDLNSENMYFDMKIADNNNRQKNTFR